MRLSDHSIILSARSRNVLAIDSQRDFPMNRFLALAFVSGLASVAGTSIGWSDSLFMNGSPELERKLRSFDGNFDVQEFYDWDESTSGDGPLSVEQRTPQAVEHIRQSILSNKKLVDRLRQKGVNVNTIINAQQAADGSMTFFTH